LDVEAVADQNKRRRKLVPHRVAEEIETLKLIPSGVANVPGKGSARFFKLHDLPTVLARLDPDAARRIDSPCALLAIRLHDRSRPIGVDGYLRLLMLRKTLHLEQLTGK